MRSEEAEDLMNQKEVSCIEKASLPKIKKTKQSKRCREREKERARRKERACKRNL